MKKILAMLLCILSACATNKEIKREYYENGSVRIETPYNGDVKNGIEKLYNKDGSLDMETLYKDDSMVWRKFYYKNGNLAIKVPFKDNKTEGIKKYYNEKGKLKKEIYYEEGSEIWEKEYDEEGVKITEREYENGNLISEKSYKDGNSIEKYYYDNGTLQQENENKGDIRISTKGYKKDGSFDFEFIRLDDVTEFHKSVMENGKVVGLKNIYYDKDKKVLKKSEFYIGDILYDIMKYDENGILTVKTYYTKNGKEKYSEEYYYPNGNLKTDIMFKNGSQIKVEEYDEDGNIISKDDK